MKRHTIWMIILLLLGLTPLPACSGQDDATQPKPEATAQDVQKEDAEATETVQEDTPAQKEGYMQKIDARLEALDRELEALGEQVESGSGEMKKKTQAEYQETMAALKDRQAEAARQYEKLKESGSAAWSDIKAGMDAAMEDLNTAFDKARSEFQ